MAATNIINTEETCARNGLIGPDAYETLRQVAEVLEFLAEFHLRPAESAIPAEVTAGMTHVIEYAHDALRIQMASLRDGSETTGNARDCGADRTSPRRAFS